MPGVNGMNFVLNGERDPGIETLLESGGAIRQATKLWSLELLGQSVTIDDISMLMPNAVVEGGEEHLLALRAGSGANRKAHVVPSDGIAGILIWSPERMGDLKVPAPTPWGLTGIREHRQLRPDED